MCGIVGATSLNRDPIPNIDKRLSAMSQLIEHRGPDGHGQWKSDGDVTGLAHRRLTIIDLSESGAQPMHGPNGTHICYNGESYNYIELRETLKDGWTFRGTSDTEVLLAAYAKHGRNLPSQLRGMFAFAIWDENNQSLFCARDRFGIKPFYYTIQDGVFYFASEPKALLPMLPTIDMDRQGFSEYLTFQYPISERTLFKGVHQLMPGQQLVIEKGEMKISTYWDVKYEHDHSLTLEQCKTRVRELIADSVNIHMRADVPIGSYLSGGVDSSLIAILANEFSPENNQSFHGRFVDFPGYENDPYAYDESRYAHEVADKIGNDLHVIDIKAEDFINHIGDVVKHLDHPVAGIGSFPQYMVSKLASEHVKVVLGGQGGDEIFGGYARYMVGYLEQLISGALDGNLDNGDYGVSFESVIPNLTILKKYRPLLKTFWKEGLWESADQRFFRLIDRSTDLSDEIVEGAVDHEHVAKVYSDVYNDRSVIGETDYLNGMSRFDFKRLLPALLQVEDRMSMAHGLESRVPFLDHPLIEFAATIPPALKYPGGRLKELLRASYEDKLPTSLFQREDKMGFPVPLTQWYGGEVGDFIRDTFHSDRARQRAFLNSDKAMENFSSDSTYSRKTWGLLNLELWHQTFYDRAHEYRAMIA
jgi:asparagine synthase (glutamine-hydrolysing)